MFPPLIDTPYCLTAILVVNSDTPAWWGWDGRGYCSHLLADCVTWLAAIQAAFRYAPAWHYFCMQQLASIILCLLFSSCWVEVQLVAHSLWSFILVMFVVRVRVCLTVLYLKWGLFLLVGSSCWLGLSSCGLVSSW